MKHETLEVQLVAVRQNGFNIEYIKNPPVEVQLEAVRQNAYAIEFIDNPPLEVQLLAVKQNGYVIKDIKNPPLQVQLAAITDLAWAIKQIKNPPLEVQLLSIKLLSANDCLYDALPSSVGKGCFKDITYDVIIADRELIDYKILRFLLKCNACIYSDNEVTALQVLRDSLA